MKNLFFTLSLSFFCLCYISNSYCAATNSVKKGNSHPTHVGLNGKGVSKILTTKGYKPVQTVNVGDSVVAYLNGGEIVNTVLSVENITPTDRLYYLINGVSMPGTKLLVVNVNGNKKKSVQDLAIGDIFYRQNNPVTVATKSVDTVNSVRANKDFYLVNNKWNLYSEQSIWANNNVTHAKLLHAGDTIYDDGDAPVIITSVLKNTNLTSWYRFSISGDHSYIVNGLTLHNASRYWVGGGSSPNWNATVKTNWSSGSGGVNDASIPGTADAVIFDNHSGGANSYVNSNTSINSINCGAYKGTLTLNAGITLKVFADFTLNTVFDGFTGMAFYVGNPVSSTLEFAGGGTQNITTSGQTLGTVIFDGFGGTVNLMDNINCIGGISLNGDGGYTFNTNGKNITTPYFDGQGNYMTVNLGASVITCTGNDSNLPYWQTTFRLVNWQEDPVVTVNRGTSKIIFNDISSISKTFNSPFTLYDLQFTGGGSGTYQLYALHLHQLTDNAATTAHSLLFYGGGITTTFDVIPLLTGSAGHIITIGTYSGYTYGTLSCASGTFTGDYLNINNSHATGGATWNAGNHSTDGGGNTGWVFSVSASAGVNTTICTGSSATIGGAPTAYGGTLPYTYSWTPSSGLSSTTDANPIASPTVTQIYNVTVTDHIGRTSIASAITVTVNSLPTPPTISSSSIIPYCAGDSITLTASSTNAYFWSTGATTQSITVAASDFYFLTATGANGCQATTVYFPPAIQTQEWAVEYSAVDSIDNNAIGIVSDTLGYVYVAGSSTYSATSSDIVTFKYASNGQLSWFNTFNGSGNGNDYATAIAIDNSANIYVTGISTASAGCTDITTIKYNSLGVQQWVATYDDNTHGCDGSNAIALDAGGNVYVTGFAIGTDSDFVTIKYNPAGVQQWVKTYNGPGNGSDVAKALAVDGSGNVYVTGKSYGGSGTNMDYATLKYNASGTQQWVSRYNGAGNDKDMPNAIVLDLSGNIYVTGGSKGSSGGGSNYDYATIKYNSSGILQWLNLYNGTTGTGLDMAKSLAIKGNTLYVTGTSIGGGSNNDYVTIQYNTNGALNWIQRYNNGTGSDEANALTIDTIGNVYITGNSNGCGTNADYLTIKLNSSGQLQWTKTYDGAVHGLDQPNAIVIDRNQNVFVTGKSKGTGTGYHIATVKYGQMLFPIGCD